MVTAYLNLVKKRRQFSVLHSLRSYHNISPMLLSPKCHRLVAWSVAVLISHWVWNTNNVQMYIQCMGPGRCNKQGLCKVYTCARLLFTAKLHHMYFHHKSSNGGHSRTYFEQSKLDWRVLKLLLESKIFHHKVVFKIFKHVKKISFCGFHCLHRIFPSMHWWSL